MPGWRSRRTSGGGKGDAAPEAGLPESSTTVSCSGGRMPCRAPASGSRLRRWPACIQVLVRWKIAVCPPASAAAGGDFIGPALYRVSYHRGARHAICPGGGREGLRVAGRIIPLGRRKGDHDARRLGCRRRRRRVTWSGRAKAAPTCPLWPSPAAMASVYAVLVRWKVTVCPPASAAATLTAYGPPLPRLAVAAALATPSVPVVAVKVAGPVLAPEAGAVKLTTTPGAGLPASSSDGHLERQGKGGAHVRALVVTPGDGQRVARYWSGGRSRSDRSAAAVTAYGPPFTRLAVAAALATPFVPVVARECGRAGSSRRKRGR